MPDPLHRNEVESEVEDEVDSALVELEQALHRREALILVTDRNAGAHRALIQKVLERYDDAFVIVVVSAAEAAPITAVDKLIESAGENSEEASTETKPARLERLTSDAAAAGQPILVVVEDAELATTTELERLRIALQIQQTAVRSVQLILGGSQRLVRKLRKRDARGLRTRITTHVAIPAEPAPARPKPKQVSHEAAKNTSLRDLSQKGSRRSQVMTALSAGVLVAAVFAIVMLARRTEVAQPERVARTTVQAARSIGPAPDAPVPVASAPASAVPGAAPANAPGAVAPLQAPPVPTAGAASPVVPAVPVTGATASGASAPDASSGAVAASATKVSEPTPQRSSGPTVSETLGVETLRGTVPRKLEPARETPPGSEPQAPGTTGDGVASSHPATVARAEKAGAQVVSVDNPGEVAAVAKTPPPSAAGPQQKAASPPQVVASATNGGGPASQVAAASSQAGGTAAPGITAPAKPAGATATGTTAPAKPTGATATGTTAPAKPAGATATGTTAPAKPTGAAGASVAVSAPQAGTPGPGIPTSVDKPGVAAKSATAPSPHAAPPAPQVAAGSAKVATLPTQAGAPASMSPAPGADPAAAGAGTSQQAAAAGEPIEKKTASVTAKPESPATHEQVAAAALAPTESRSGAGSTPGGVTMQVGAFSNPANAAALQKSLLTEFPSVEVEETSVAGKPFFRVRVGPFDNSVDAKRAEERLKAMGHTPLRYGRAKKSS